MAAVALLLRARRGAWRAWLAVVLLLALPGGAVLAMGAGARRTDTAYPRFLAASDTSDVIVAGLQYAGPDSAEQAGQLVAAIRRLPQVADAAVADYVLASVALPSGRRLGFNDISPLALGDTRFATQIDRFKVLDGRLADPSRPGEAVVSFPLAEAWGLHVGDVLVVHPLRPEDVQAAGRSGQANPDVSQFARGTPRPIRIVGIVASSVAYDFPPLPPRQGGSVYFTPAFLHHDAAELAAYPAIAVRLRHGVADLRAFEDAGERLTNGQQMQYIAASDHEAVVQSALHLQAMGLGLLAGLAALVLLLVLVQGVVRRITLEAADNTALRALGVTRPQLWSVAMLRALVAAVAGAAGAVVVATLLSPLMPIGLAQRAEPAPGFAFDVAVVLGGAAAMALLVVLAACVPAWRAAGDRGTALEVRRGSRLAELLARAGFPATAVAGVRLALEAGRGRRAVPVRSAITACALAAGTVAGAICFTASLGHLLDTPRLYGWTWDAEVTGLLDVSHAAGDISRLPTVAAVAQGVTGDIVVDADRVAGLAMEPVKGSVEPALVGGRLPHGDDEIVLGTQTDSGARLGQEVTVHVGPQSRRMRVVGRAVIPVLSDTSRLGVGAWLTYGGLHRLLGDANTPPPDTFLVRSTADQAAGLQALMRLYGKDGVVPPQPPTGLSSFGGVSALPVLLGGVLAAGAVATLAHAVATSVRRRRRELAILKTLGFVRRQVAASVAWQTTTVAAIGAVIGVPVGAAAGRWAWTLFATQQGMLAEPVLPLWWLVLLLPAALLLANLVAAIPGRYAARTSPALVLRAE